MKLISAEVYSQDLVAGTRKVKAFMVSSGTPSPLPTNGQGIEGLESTDTFAPFSMIYVAGEATTKLYIANEDGVFQPQ